MKILTSLKSLISNPEVKAEWEIILKDIPKDRKVKFEAFISS